MTGKGSDETKINRFQSEGKEYYWHRFDGVDLFYLVESRSLCENKRQNEKRGYLRILECNIPDFVEERAYQEK